MFCDAKFKTYKLYHILCLLPAAKDRPALYRHIKWSRLRLIKSAVEYSKRLERAPLRPLLELCLLRHR